MLMGREDDALAALEKAIEVDSTAYNALVNLGVYYQNRGDLVSYCMLHSGACLVVEEAITSTSILASFVV